MLVQAKVWRLDAVKTGVHICRCVKVWGGGGGGGIYTPNVLCMDESAELTDELL